MTQSRTQSDLQVLNDSPKKVRSLGYAAGLGLLGAGLLMERATPRTRLLLSAAGAGGIFWLASRLDPAGHAEPATYPPLDTLKRLADDIWVVDSGPLHGVLPVRMTVVRLPDGGVLLHSPTRTTPGLRAELDRIGPVRALVAPNQAHWMFLPDWKAAYPDAVTFGAPGLRNRGAVRKAGVAIDRDLSETAPQDWGGTIDLVSVPGSLGFSEFALFHRPSATLVLTDLVLNLEPARLPWLMRPFARLVGATGPIGRAPIYLRAVVRGGGKAARAAGARLVQLQPQRVVFSHGRMFEGDAAASLARSLAWLLPAGHQSP